MIKVQEIYILNWTNLLVFFCLYYLLKDYVKNRAKILIVHLNKYRQKCKLTVDLFTALVYDAFIFMLWA